MFRKVRNVLRKSRKLRIPVKRDVAMETLQRLLRPMNILQLVFNCPKYRIKNNIIIPNGKIAICFNLIKMLGLMTLNTNRIFNIGGDMRKKIENRFSLIMHCCGGINYSFQAAGFILTFINDVTQSQYFIKLVLKLQKIINVLNFEKRSIDKMILFNYLHCLLCFVTFFIVDMITQLYFGNINYEGFVSDIPLICFDINMLYATRVIVLLKNMIEKCQENILDIRKSDVLGKKQRLEQMCETHVDILDALRLYEIVFRDLILYYIIDTFVHTVIYMGLWTILTLTAIKATGSYKFSWRILTLAVIAILKRLVQVLVLVVAAERAAAAAEDSFATATTLLAADDASCAERRSYKRLRRSHAAASKLGLRGLATVDAPLLARLATTVTTAAIVLLQFAFMYS